MLDERKTEITNISKLKPVKAPIQLDPVETPGNTVDADRLWAMLQEAMEEIDWCHRIIGADYRRIIDIAKGQ